MAPVSVIDSISGREEHIVDLAKRLGSKRKKLLFAEIYKGKKATKTVSELARILNLTEKQILDAGIQLVNAHAITQTKVGGRVAYSKVPGHKAIRDEILRAAGQPDKIAAIRTKRSGTISADSLYVLARSRSASPKRERRKSGAKIDLRIAFLMSSPHDQGQLNLGIEFRDVSRAIKLSQARDRVELRLFPAVNASGLLEALNEFKPHIVHFSGHAGDESLVMDSNDLSDAAAVVLDYDVAIRMLRATSDAPKLIVLNACETLKGAEAFLAAAPMVVAMSASIGDTAAAYFATRFYSALVAGQSVEHSVEQARAFLQLEGDPDAELPTAIAKPGVDAKLYKLI